jgi:formylglycine-generating enzyme required for sulfatase activity
MTKTRKKKCRFRWTFSATGSANRRVPIIVWLLLSAAIPLLRPVDVRGQTADELAARLKTFRGELIKITPGANGFPASFAMGRDDASRPNEGPVHTVHFGYAFEVAKYEVTQDLWQAVMGQNASRWKGPRNSAEMLSLDDAQEFCRRATQLMRQAGLIAANQEIRLPTEAEWEYVARAGTTTRYSYGDDPQLLDAYAWYTGNAAGNDPPVGAKRPNPWGLYDVHGYLWEWCADTAHDNYHQAPGDGSAWVDHAAATTRILRGGSWKDPADQLTSSYRRSAPAALRDDAVGLRCVLAPAK